MALNIKTFGTRTLSALLFVVVLLGCVMWNYCLFVFLFLFVSLIGLKEFYGLQEKSGNAPFKFAGYFMAILTYLSFVNWQFLFLNSELLFSITFEWIVLLPFVFLMLALFKTEVDALKNGFVTFLGILYAVIPFCLLHLFVFKVPQNITPEYDPKLLLGIIFLIWCNDTAAYLGGSLFGKHKLIERISPGKTWEGTVTGIVLSFILSLLIQTYMSDGHEAYWLYLGIFVPVVGTIGDLVESLMKRQAGVKDSGNIMPGHGGILDRFDSLIFVSPFVVFFLKILNL